MFLGYLDGQIIFGLGPNMVEIANFECCLLRAEFGKKHGFTFQNFDCPKRPS